MEPNNYRVFARKPWAGSRRAGFRPAPHARKRTVAYVATTQEARDMCATGPANMARDAGQEYRHLSFYEFEGI